MIKVAFVDFLQTFHDRHAVYSLSAYLKDNDIETYYVNHRSFSRTISKIREINPDLLLYSTFSGDINLYVEFDKAAKKHLGIKSVIGGPGPTFDQKCFEKSTIDALCIGEGEYALVDYIKSGFVPSKNIVNNDHKRVIPEYAPFVDLDAVPFPDRQLVYKNDYVLRNMPSKQFLAGRGCPYKCTYCHNSIQNEAFKGCGPIIRIKSVDYLIEEIKDIKRRYPLKTVVFQDDTFILKKKWLQEFCERFQKEVGLPYTCNIRANLINEDTIRTLKESNCVTAYWSIESGNEFFRNKVLKRQMSEEQILETGHLLKKYNISHRNGGLLGLPGESFEQMLETLELNIKTTPDFGFASIFVPFQGLELTKYAQKHNYLSEGTENSLPNNTHSRSALNYTDEENLRIQKLTYLYPILIKYPKLFYNHKIFKLLFKLPKTLLFLNFHLFSGYELSKLYKVEVKLLLKIAILWRYIKHPF